MQAKTSVRTAEWRMSAGKQSQGSRKRTKKESFLANQGRKQVRSWERSVVLVASESLGKVRMKQELFYFPTRCLVVGFARALSPEWWVKPDYMSRWPVQWQSHPWVRLLLWGPWWKEEGHSRQWPGEGGPRSRGMLAALQSLEQGSSWQEGKGEMRMKKTGGGLTVMSKGLKSSSPDFSSIL